MSSTTIRTYIKGGDPTRPKLLILARHLKSPDLLVACGFDDLADALTEELAAPDPATTLALPGLSVEAHQLVEALDNYVQAAIRQSRPGP